MVEQEVLFSSQQFNVLLRSKDYVPFLVSSVVGFATEIFGSIAYVKYFALFKRKVLGKSPQTVVQKEVPTLPSVAPITTTTSVDGTSKQSSTREPFASSGSISEMTPRLIAQVVYEDVGEKIGLLVGLVVSVMMADQNSSKVEIAIKFLVLVVLEMLSDEVKLAGIRTAVQTYYTEHFAFGRYTYASAVCAASSAMYGVLSGMLLINCSL